MHQPEKSLSTRPGASPISRRRLLAGAGGALAAGALVSNGGLASAAGARRPSLARAAARAASTAKPTLSQWYHEYGEAGTLDAVKRYAAEYPDATIEIEWIPGDYTTALSSALLTDNGPDVFEAGNGPSIDQIQSGQVVPLDGILGDAESDFNERLIKRVTYDGHLWGVPQVVDMQLLVYRKSLLEAAGLEPPTTLDELIAAASALTTGDVKGLFLGNDGGAGVLGGPLLWSAGADYLTEDGQFGFENDAVNESFAKVRELYQGDSLLLGAPTEWFDPGSFINELTAIQWTGLWTLPAISASAIADDYDVIAWPAFDSSTGTGSVPIGAFASSVSAKSIDVEASKAYVKWLWVDNTEDQSDFALSYGFHIPSRNSLAAAAEPLKSGAAANAVKLSQENGFTQTPLLWTPASDSAYSDARIRIIQEGADPAEEIAKVRETAEAELERIGAGSSGPGSSAPVSSEAMSTEAAGTVPATTG